MHCGSTMRIIEDSNDSFQHRSITSRPNRCSRSPSDQHFYNRPSLNYSKTRSRSPSCSKRKYKSSSKSNSSSDDSQRSYRSHSQDSTTKSCRHDERSKSLNIFGLNYGTKTPQLFDLFKKYGSIDRINVVVDETGKSRGFGFVDFKSYEDSEEALKKCSGIEIDGKKILVEFSSSQRSPTPIPGISMDDLDITPTWRRAYEERYHKDTSRSKRKYCKSRPRSNSFSGDHRRSYRRHSQDSATKSSKHDESSRSLDIFGLNYGTKKRQLFDVFKKYGSIDRINVVVDETGKSRGFGFVDFKSYEDSEEALKKCSGIEIDGKKILVEFSSSKRSPTPIPGISMDDLDITPTWRRAYEERYHKDRNNYHSKRSSPTYKKSHVKSKDRSRSRS